MSGLRHVRGRWPDPEVPEGEPSWLLYEIDDLADAVTRSVDIFDDGKVLRNSIEIEERNGLSCPSLIDVPLSEGFGDADLEDISADEFEAAWAKGVDTPFWNVR
jgi:hypothetical protein